MLVTNLYGVSPYVVSPSLRSCFIVLFIEPKNQRLLLLTLSNRYSENSNLKMEFCAVLCNAILKSYTKNEENLFSHFLLIIIFPLIRIYLEISCGTLQCHFKVSWKKSTKSIHEIPIYANRFYRRAPKLGTHRSSRFEKVK